MLLIAVAVAVAVVDAVMLLLLYLSNFNFYFSDRIQSRLLLYLADTILKHSDDAPCIKGVLAHLVQPFKHNTLVPRSRL